MLNKSELQSYLDVHNLFFHEQFSKMYLKTRRIKLMKSTIYLILKKYLLL